MMYLLLVIGFALLIVGADLFVEGSSSIAKLLKVPSVVIGLTVVAMGTSAPEAAVSITAGLAGNSDISLGNVIGSNLFNLLMVVGIAAVIHPLPMQREILRRDLPWNIIATAVLFVMILGSDLGPIEGILLLCGIAGYLVFLVRNALKTRTEESPIYPVSLPKALLFIVLGLSGVIFGGDMVVDNACRIASALGMSDTLVGLTIVAIGTSLPELATSITAARKGDSGIAMGNAVGSCLFNIMFILGMASVLAPIHAAPELLIDTGILILVSLLLFLFGKTKMQVNRWEGALCILIYIGYMAYIILR